MTPEVENTQLFARSGLPFLWYLKPQIATDNHKTKIIRVLFIKFTRTKDVLQCNDDNIICNEKIGRTFLVDNIKNIMKYYDAYNLVSFFRIENLLTRIFF